MDYQSMREFKFELVYIRGKLTKELVHDYCAKTGEGIYILHLSKDKATIVTQHVGYARDILRVNERFIVSLRTLTGREQYASIYESEYKKALYRLEHAHFCEDPEDDIEESELFYTHAELRDLGIPSWTPRIVKTYIQYGGSRGAECIYVCDD
jgi:hypothetical protein